MKAELLTPWEFKSPVMRPTQTPNNNSNILLRCKGAFMIFANIQTDMGRPEPGSVILVNGRERIVRQVNGSCYPGSEKAKMQATVIHFDNVDHAVYPDECQEQMKTVQRWKQQLREQSHPKLNDYYCEED